ncbi:MAG: primosomal protein N' [Clostridia bacterium]|nr:primosomal protein N' [Clostridia bacterium]
MRMENIALVILSHCTREFDKEYSYLIPSHLISKVKPGVRVIVPFGRANRSLEAYVLGVTDRCDVKEMKEIKKVIDDEPVIGEELLKLCPWMRKRYICTYHDAVRCMVPPGIGIKTAKWVRLTGDPALLRGNVKKVCDKLMEYGNEAHYDELKDALQMKSFSKYINALRDQGLVEVVEIFRSSVREKTVRVAYIIRPPQEIIDEIEDNRIKKIQQIRVLEMLLENEYISVPDIVRFSGVSPSVLDTLKKYGYIDFKEIEVIRNPLTLREVKRTTPLKPTPEQEKVLNFTKGLMEKNTFSEILLHGVTGSGKTEVYLQLIEFCFNLGKQAIVLVPEISLTPQMVERFKGRFGDLVAVQHSRLSLGERYDQWRLIKDGKIKVVVGARSAVFAPFDKLGMVIIDEEHESTYKSEITPKYHAREIARERCVLKGAVLLLGSATPSVETYYQAKNGHLHLIEMCERANRMLMPKVKLVDMREELNEGNRSVFSGILTEEMEKNVHSGQQTILFLNKRGFSSFILCRNCGFTLRCRSCNVALTYHLRDQRLICHYCGFTFKNPENCPKCKSTSIRYFGTGTQRVEEEIQHKFKNASVLRMDMDTTTTKNSHEEILRTFREKNINILVGTQMIAKGHDFPNVTLVGILAADSALNVGDFRASERTFQLITQVAGRAGRGQIPGRVVIQTYNTEDFSILSACNHDYQTFFNQEILVRQKLCYPPFSQIASIIVSGGNDRQVFNRIKALKDFIQEYMEELNIVMELLGPARAPLAKINNKYRWRMIIKASTLDPLIQVLTGTWDAFYKKKEKASLQLSVDINPFNML